MLHAVYEYNKGHLIQAININWLDSQFDIEARKQINLNLFYIVNAEEEC
jgi:hypothetical protein